MGSIHVYWQTNRHTLLYNYCIHSVSKRMPTIIIIIIAPIWTVLRTWLAFTHYQNVCVSIVLLLAKHNFVKQGEGTPISTFPSYWRVHAMTWWVVVVSVQWNFRIETRRINGVTCAHTQSVLALARTDSVKLCVVCICRWSIFEITERVIPVMWWYVVIWILLLLPIISSVWRQLQSKDDRRVVRGFCMFVCFSSGDIVYCSYIVLPIKHDARRSCVSLNTQH